MAKAIWPVMLVALLTACHSGGSYHQPSMPDPAAHNAHSGDMDTSRGGQVTSEAFKAHFPQAGMNVCEVIDVDQDIDRSHEEWHRFKKAHGLKHS